jgi:lactate racemase
LTTLYFEKEELLMLLAYGREKVPLTFLEELDWQEVALPYLAPLEDPVSAFRDALKRPIGHEPLGETVRAGERVCIIVNDSTRVARSDVFLPVLIDELEAAGVREEDIFIVFSNGSHRLMSKDEMTALVGTGVAERIAMYNHDCADEDNLVYRGETSRGVPLYLNKRVCEADLSHIDGQYCLSLFCRFRRGKEGVGAGGGRPCYH